jgi:hypothetical protein
LRTISLGWLQTTILLISASQVARVVGILTDEKPSDTWRSGELGFYFMPAGSDVCLSI